MAVSDTGSDLRSPLYLWLVQQTENAMSANYSVPQQNYERGGALKSHNMLPGNGLFSSPYSQIKEPYKTNDIIQSVGCDKMAQTRFSLYSTDRFNIENMFKDHYIDSTKDKRAINYILGRN